MVQEQYVSFETAKLLKEKGVFFDINTYYGEDGNRFISPLQVSRPNELIERPTQQLVLRWLREMHRLFIELSPCINGYDWAIYDRSIEKVAEECEMYFSYEEACEAAIIYCLENVI